MGSHDLFKRPLTPSDLLVLWDQGIRPNAPVSVDTETSGLFVDDGARMSTVSVAWLDPDHIWDIAPHQWGGGIQHTAIEVIDADYSDWVVSFAWPFDQGVSDTGKAEDAGYATMWPDADNQPQSEWEALLEWLRRCADLTMHHAKFDLHIIEAGCRRWPGIGADLQEWVTWDTQNVANLIYPTQVTVWRADMKRDVPTSSLKPVSSWLWGEGETDEQAVIKKYLTKNKLPGGRWDLMPWDIIAKYAEQDARLTARLRVRQERDIELRGFGSWLTGESPRLSVAEAVQRRLDTSLMLFRVEDRGLPFNTKKAQKYSRALAAKKLELEATLPFKRHTLPGAKDYWFGDGPGELGHTPLERTATGAPSINKTVIDQMIKQGIPGAETWRDIQKISTADERWYGGWSSMAGSDGRLRCSVRQNGTVSSRFSVERVQLQAIPQNYRLSEFTILEGIPTPRSLIKSGVPSGWKLWELDLAQAELRVAALYANCTSMLRLIDEGADLHGVTAKQLFPTNEEKGNWGYYRNIAKRANFSLIFGSGWETFQEAVYKETGIFLPDEEARKIVEDWNALYPEYKRAIYAHKGVVERRMAKNDGVGWIDTVNGERRWWTPGEETHKAFNQRVQPNLAQFGIDWWLESEAYLVDAYGNGPVASDTGYVGRVGIVMMIHDSQLPLVPDNAEGEAHVQHLVDIGVRLWEERFPGVPGGVDAKEFGK